MDSEHERLLVVIPAFNEARRIKQVIDDVRAHAPANLAILVVDDGSADDTALVSRQAGVWVAQHPVNLGYGSALQTGYRFALSEGFDAVVQLDADGQHDPRYVADLLEALRTSDVVVGSRFLGNGSYRVPWARRIGMRTFGSIASWLAGQRITDPTSGFQAISRRALKFYVHERYPVDFPDADVLAMVARAGLRLREVAVVMNPPPDGHGMHTGILKPIYYALRMFLALALVPLRGERA